MNKFLIAIFIAFFSQFSQSINDVIHDGNKYISVGNGKTGVSYDGKSWVFKETAELNNWSSLVYCNSRYIAVANSGSNKRAMLSVNGEDWLMITTPKSYKWEGLACGNNRVVAVASGGVGANLDRVMTTDDGVIWNMQSAANNNRWWDVSHDESFFIAVAAQGSGDRSMMSVDGEAWVSNPVVMNAWRSIDCNNSSCVAVSSTGAGNRAMKTFDGVNWSTKATPDNKYSSVSVCLGGFIATSYDGTNRVITSSDGDVWSEKTTPSLFYSSSAGTLLQCVAATLDDLSVASDDGEVWETAISGEIGIEDIYSF